MARPAAPWGATRDAATTGLCGTGDRRGFYECGGAVRGSCSIGGESAASARSRRCAALYVKLRRLRLVTLCHRRDFVVPARPFYLSFRIRVMPFNGRVRYGDSRIHTVGHSARPTPNRSRVRHHREFRVEIRRAVPTYSIAEHGPRA